MKPKMQRIIYIFQATLIINLFFTNLLAEETEEILPVGQIRQITPPAKKTVEFKKLETGKDGKDVQYEIRKERKFEFHLTGGISLEAMYDSRQVEGAKFDEFIFVPSPQKVDSSGLDINAKDQFNMMGVRACCGAHIKGPDIWGARTSGVIEGEFNGIGDDTVRLFRLERAYANFAWKNTTVLFGHYYHPLVLDEMFPETISRGQGRVYDPFDRVPQVKLRHRINQFELVFAISKKFDLQAARWAAVPDLFGQVNLLVRDHVLGMGLNYHSEVPRIFSQVPPADVNPTEVEETYKTTSQIDSICPFVFAALRFEPFDIRLRATYAENGSAYDLIGAYGVQCRNEKTDERIYVNLRTLALWADLIYKKWSHIEPAVFVGFSKNLGSSRNIIKGYEYFAGDISEDPECVSLLEVAGSTTEVDYTFILAPRLRVRFGEFCLGAELEYTRASFARPFTETGWEDDYSNKGEIINGKPTSNFRILLATFYNFDYIPFSYK